MPQIDVTVMRMALFIIEPQAGFYVFTGFRQLPAQPVQRPRGMVRLQQDLRVIELARNPEEIGRNFAPAIKPTEVHVEEPQVDNGWRKIRRALEPMPDLGSPFYRHAHLRRRPPMYGH